MIPNVIPMKINVKHIGTLLVLGVFCLIPLSMGVCLAEETSQFVKVGSEHVEYEKVRTDMVKNASQVSISVELTNFIKELEGNISELVFQSDLGEPVWGISTDNTPTEWSNPFTVDHQEVEKAKITLIGNAPEAFKRKENVTLLKLTQKIQEKEYSVIEIKRDVSSESIEAAIDAIFTAGEGIATANAAIAEAEEAGVAVDEAKTRLELANEHFDNANQLYNEGRSGEALAKAELALASAQDAEARAESAVGGKTQRIYGVIAAVVIIAVVAVVLVLQQRKRKRGVY